MKHVVFAVKTFRHCFPIALEQARQADLKSSGKNSFPELFENGELYYPHSLTQGMKIETPSQSLGTFSDVTNVGPDQTVMSDGVIQRESTFPGAMDT
ncbi:hypothetical protein EP232_03520 [bacterium]|nr:MAG: hypothetical protein EP232_03520 [bacterium]